MLNHLISYIKKQRNYAKSKALDEFYRLHDLCPLYKQSKYYLWPVVFDVKDPSFDRKIALSIIFYHVFMNSKNLKVWIRVMKQYKQILKERLTKNVELLIISSPYDSCPVAAHIVTNTIRLREFRCYASSWNVDDSYERHTFFNNFLLLNKNKAFTIKKRTYSYDAESWVELAHKLRAEGEESELLSIVDLQS